MSTKNNQDFFLNSEIFEENNFVSSSKLNDLLSKINYLLFGNNLTGIEITKEKIFITEITNKKGQSILSKMDSISHNGLADSQDLTKKIKYLFAKNNFAKNNITLIIPNNFAVTGNTTLSYLNDKKIKTAIKDKYLHEDKLKNCYITYNITAKNKETKEAQLDFVAAYKNEIDPLINAVKKANLNLKQIEFRFNATYRSYLQSNSNAPENALLLDLTESEIFLSIFNHEQNYLYNLNLDQRYIKAILNNDLTYLETLATKISNIITSKHKNLNSKKIFVNASSNNLDIVITKLNELMPEYQISELNLFTNSLEVPNEFKVSQDNANYCLSSWTSALSNILDLCVINPKQDNNSATQSSANATNNFAKTAIMASIVIAIFVFCAQYSLSTYIKEQGKNASLTQKINNLAKLTLDITDKKKILASLQTQASYLDSIAEIMNKTKSNQETLLNLHHFLSENVSEGLWFKEINFSSPNKIEIVGGSISDHNVIDFLNSLNSSDKFEKLALKNIKSIEAIDELTLEDTSHKIFTLSGTLPTETDYENKVKLLASTLER